jgi:ATP-dependent Lon protease
MADAYPVLPLPSVVMFPNLMTQIHTADPYLDLLHEEIQRFDNQFITTMMVKNGDYFYQTGCLVKLEAIEEGPQGTKIMTIRGLQKFFIEQCPITHPVIYAEGKLLSDYCKDENRAVQDALHLTKLLQRFIFLTQNQPEPLLQAVSFMNEASMLSNFCAHYVLDDATEKQEFLQTLNINKRLGWATRMVEGAISDKLKEQTAHHVY